MKKAASLCSKLDLDLRGSKTFFFRNLYVWLQRDFGILIMTLQPECISLFKNGLTLFKCITYYLYYAKHTKLEL